MAQHLNKAELEARLWSEIGKARYGMLRLVGQTPHLDLGPRS
jgi:hypothetical protein